MCVGGGPLGHLFPISTVVPSDIHIPIGSRGKRGGQKKFHLIFRLMIEDMVVAILMMCCSSFRDEVFERH